MNKQVFIYLLVVSLLATSVLVHSGCSSNSRRWTADCLVKKQLQKRIRAKFTDKEGAEKNDLR